MNKIEIPKWLASEIEYKRERSEMLAVNTNDYPFRLMYDVISDIEDFKGVSLVTLARAMEEGYKVEREYLSAAQVLELPAGTKVMSESPRLIGRVATLGNGKAIFDRWNNKPVSLFNLYLGPVWFVID